MRRCHFDPESLNIGPMISSIVTYEGADKTIVQMALDFKMFTIGPVPESAANPCF